jgi:hypothetical protein
MDSIGSIPPSRVTWTAAPPFAGIFQIWVLPVRSEVK